MDRDPFDVTGPQPERGVRAEQMDPKPTDELVIGEAPAMRSTGLGFSVSHVNPDGSKSLAVRIPDETQPDPAMLADVVATAQKQLAEAIASGKQFGLVVGDKDGSITLTGMLSIHQLKLALLAAAESIGLLNEGEDE